MSQPQGFVNRQYPNYVCKLNKAIYGLKQAPRAWFETFTSQLLTHGFTQSQSNTSLLSDNQETLSPISSCMSMILF